MEISDFLKDKIDQGKKAVIKFKIKSVIKKKVDLSDNIAHTLDSSLDRAIDKIGVDNIIKAAKTYKALKKQFSIKT